MSEDLQKKVEELEEEVSLLRYTLERHRMKYENFKITLRGALREVLERVED